MNLTYVRLICMISMLLISMVSILLPVFIENAIKKRKRYFDLLTNTLNCLSSGIFFGMLTLDLWPSAMGSLVNEEDGKRYVDTQFPIESFSIAVGFFIIFLIEQFQDNIGKSLNLTLF